MKKLLAILLLICCVPSWSADLLTEYIATLEQQEISKQWVDAQATEDLSEDKTTQIVSHTYAHSIALGISPLLILAVTRVESGFRPHVTSSHGAKGLMQVMPKPHRKALAGRNVFNPSVNIEVGSMVLGDCLERNNRNVYKALNCYSGGGGRRYYQSVQKALTELTNFVRSESRRPTTSLFASNP